MSGKSGQLLTSTFFDDCENIVLYHGYPAFKVEFESFFASASEVSFSSFEDASNRLGLSIEVLKDLTKLANVNLLSFNSGGRLKSVFSLGLCGFASIFGSVHTSIEFGSVSQGFYFLEVDYMESGDFLNAKFRYQRNNA
jgi:hypothetical protein